MPRLVRPHIFPPISIRNVLPRTSLPTPSHIRVTPFESLMPSTSRQPITPHTSTLPSHFSLHPPLPPTLRSLPGHPHIIARPPSPHTALQTRYTVMGAFYQPSTRKRKRKHGFLVRKRSVGGRKMLKRRLVKGRRFISH